MNEFKRYHPTVNFIYFLCVISFACIFLHPVTHAISLVMSFSCLSMLKKGLMKRLLVVLSSLLIVAIINPLFNHRGATILAYFPSGNPLTFESVLYGFISASMIVSVILYFSCFNEIITSDKITYLFGRIIPTLALIFSMVLKFVPRFSAQMKTVIESRKALGKISGKSIVKKIKEGLSVLSIMIVWSLENAVETADSMKSRGYGIPGRTSFSIYTFSKRDKTALFAILLEAGYVIGGAVFGKLYFECFPAVSIAEITPYGVSVFVAYFLLCATPVLIELWEVKKWKSLR